MVRLHTEGDRAGFGVLMRLHKIARESVNVVELTVSRCERGGGKIVLPKRDVLPIQLTVSAACKLRQRLATESALFIAVKEGGARVDVTCAQRL